MFAELQYNIPLRLMRYHYITIKWAGETLPSFRYRPAAGSTGLLGWPRLIFRRPELSGRGRIQALRSETFSWGTPQVGEELGISPLLGHTTCWQKGVAPCEQATPLHTLSADVISGVFLAKYFHGLRVFGWINAVCPPLPNAK